MSDKASIRSYFGRVLIAIFLSVIIPLGLGYIKGASGTPIFNANEQIIMGAIIFLISLVSGIAADVHHLAIHRKAKNAYKRLEGSNDITIDNIKTGLSELAKHPPDNGSLFFRYYSKELVQLENRIRDACNLGELNANENIISTTSMLLDVVESKRKHIIRLVHKIDSSPNDFDYTGWSRMYYERLTKITNESNIELRRLFVFENTEHASENIPQLLFKYHKSVSWGYRIMSNDDWFHILNGSSIRVGFNEYGVWDDIVFFSDLTEKNNVIGKYLNSPDIVSSAIEVFDIAWDQSTIPLISDRKKTIKIEELFDNSNG